MKAKTMVDRLAKHRTKFLEQHCCEPHVTGITSHRDGSGKIYFKAILAKDHKGSRPAVVVNI